MSSASLFWGLVFGSFGIGYFVYGKRQEDRPPICGILLMVFPYFVPGTIPLVLIGAAIMAVPYFFRS